MANTYLSTAFEVEAQSVELDRLVAMVALVDAVADESPGPDPVVPAILLETMPSLGTAPDLSVELANLLEARIDGPVCATLRRSTPTLVAVSGEQSPDVDLLAACIRTTCPSALPMGFTFAITSDRPDVDGCNGGYVIVSRYGVDGMNAATRMEAELRSLRAERPLTPVQQLAFDTYDQSGDYAMIAEDAQEHRLKTLIRDGVIADSLALFVVNEAADAGDSFEEAADMMDRAAEQLTAVGDALRARGDDEA